MKNAWKYFIEVIVIIISILVAFWLEGWRNDNEKIKFKNRVIKNLITVINSDLAQLRSIKEQQTFSLHCSNRLIYDIEQNGNILSTDSAAFYLVNSTLGVLTFYPQEGIFNLISNTEAIEIISNDELITSLFNLYDHDLERLKSNNTIYDKNYLPMIKHISNLGLQWDYKNNRNTPVKNTMNIVYYTDQQLINYVNHSRFYSSQMISRLNAIETKYKKVKSLSLNELN